MENTEKQNGLPEKIKAAVIRYASTADLSVLTEAAEGYFNSSDDLSMYAGTLLMQIASERDGAAMRLLGMVYESEELALVHSDEKAVACYGQAAAAGDALGCFYLAEDYFGKSNLKTAERYYLQALEKRESLDSRARQIIHFKLSRCLLSHAIPDWQGAMGYLQRSADEEGDIRAYYQMAQICLKYGSANDALRYLETGAEKGDETAGQELGSLYLFGSDEYETTKDYGKAERVLKLFEKSENFVFPYYLGVLYSELFEAGDVRMVAPTVQYLKRAYELKQDPKVAAMIGHVAYLSGTYPTALTYLVEADKAGEYLYSDELGLLYAGSALGDQQDPELAMQAFEHAFSDGYLESELPLGMYAHLLMDSGDVRKTMQIVDIARDKLKSKDISFAFIPAKLLMQGRISAAEARMTKEEALPILLNWILKVRKGAGEDWTECNELIGNYYHSKGDDYNAYKHWNWAYESGSSASALKIAGLMESGYGSVRPNAEAARLWRQKAEEARAAENRVNAQKQQKAEERANRAAANKSDEERAAAEKAAAEKAAAEKAAAEKAAAERAAAEKAAAERAAAERAAAERSAAERAAAERAAAEKAAAERAAAERTTAEKAAAANEETGIPMRFCLQCGEQILQGMKFCIKCGSPVGSTARSAPKPTLCFCMHCGTPIAPDGKFCVFCGTRVGEIGRAESPGAPKARPPKAASGTMPVKTSAPKTAVPPRAVTPPKAAAKAPGGPETMGVLKKWLFNSGITDNTQVRQQKADRQQMVKDEVFQRMMQGPLAGNIAATILRDDGNDWMTVRRYGDDGWRDLHVRSHSVMVIWEKYETVPEEHQKRYVIYGKRDWNFVNSGYDELRPYHSPVVLDDRTGKTVTLDEETMCELLASAILEKMKESIPDLYVSSSRGFRYGGIYIRYQLPEPERRKGF